MNEDENSKEVKALIEEVKKNPWIYETRFRHEYKEDTKDKMWKELVIKKLALKGIKLRGKFRFSPKCYLCICYFLLILPFYIFIFTFFFNCKLFVCFF